MQLIKLPESLPIEAIEQIISILAGLIGILSQREVFDQSESIADYKETVENLSRDLEDCKNLYESWRLDDAAYKYKADLERMHIYLTKADVLIKATAPCCIH